MAQESRAGPHRTDWRGLRTPGLAIVFLSPTHTLALSLSLSFNLCRCLYLSLSLVGSLYRDSARSRKTNQPKEGPISVPRPRSGANRQAGSLTNIHLEGGSRSVQNAGREEQADIGTAVLTSGRMLEGFPGTRNPRRLPSHMNPLAKLFVATGFNLHYTSAGANSRIHLHRHIANSSLTEQGQQEVATEGGRYRHKRTLFRECSTREREQRRYEDTSVHKDRDY